MQLNSFKGPAKAYSRIRWPQKQPFKWHSVIVARDTAAHRYMGNEPLAYIKSRHTYYRNAHGLGDHSYEKLVFGSVLYVAVAMVTLHSFSIQPISCHLRCMCECGSKRSQLPLCLGLATFLCTSESPHSCTFCTFIHAHTCESSWNIIRTKNSSSRIVTHWQLENHVAPYLLCFLFSFTFGSPFKAFTGALALHYKWASVRTRIATTRNGRVCQSKCDFVRLFFSFRYSCWLVPAFISYSSECTRAFR